MKTHNHIYRELFEPQIQELFSTSYRGGSRKTKEAWSKLFRAWKHRLDFLSPQTLTSIAGMLKTIDTELGKRRRSDEGEKPRKTSKRETKHEETVKSLFHQLEKQLVARDDLKGNLENIRFALSSGQPVQRQITALSNAMAIPPKSFSDPSELLRTLRSTKLPTYFPAPQIALPPKSTKLPTCFPAALPSPVLPVLPLPAKFPTSFLPPPSPALPVSAPKKQVVDHRLETMIQVLHSNNQCRECGLRLLREEIAGHLDSHFKQKQQEIQQRKQVGFWGNLSNASYDLLECQSSVVCFER